MIELLEVCQEDEEFLIRIYKSTRLEEFAALGWPEQQLEPLLRMQFEAQRRSYSDQYPQAKQRIVAYEGNKAGHMISAYKDDSLVLVYVALLPEYRNRGIGSRLLRDLQQDALRDNVPIRLQVIQNSPARRLYERYGFNRISEASPYLAMEWKSNEVTG